MPDQTFIELMRKYLKYLKTEQPLDIDESLRTLGLDSMASVNLLLDIEEIYGISLSQKGLTNDVFSTARTLWNRIEQIRTANVKGSAREGD